MFIFTLLISVLLINLPTHRADAATGVNEQFNYQGRLLNTAGATVPDGDYNMEFTIVQDGNGCNPAISTTYPCSGTVKWTESWESTNKVTVRNGYFSVYLGSITPFGSSVDWNQDTLWLGVNIGGTGSPSYDGVMKPMKRLGASPFALNSKLLGGLLASDFVKLAQGVQTDSTTVSSVFVNKTGASGNILQLQKNGSDVFVVGNGGGLTFGAGLGIDAASGALTVGNSTASSVSICNSANCDTISIGTNTDADTINIGSTNDDTVTLSGANVYINTAGVGNVGIGNGNGGTVSISGSDWSLTDGGPIKITGIESKLAGTLTVGDAVSTGVSICNSAACDTVSIGTNADADAINIGDGSDTITLTGGSGSAFVLNGVNVSTTEFNVLDGGIDLSGSEVTGVLASGRFPALTGAITTSSGSLSTSLGSFTTSALNTALSDNDVATLAGSEALTNKTLTAAKIADLGFLADASGNEYLIFDSNASAVNELTIANAATAGVVTITATGGDTDVELSINSKGSDDLSLNGSATGNILIGGGSGSTGCTITNSSGALACTAGITGSNLSGSHSGTSSGTNTGDQTTITGNAGTATALQNARTIGGVSFDGTANITVATATGGFTVSGGTLGSANHTITSASANALAVGVNGTTNPAFNIDASTASSATGLNIKSAAAAGGLAITTLSSGTNEALTISAKGSGTLTLASGSTGDIQFFSSSNKITSGGALTIAGALSASNFSGSHSGTSSGTNTGDQTSVTGNAGTATALQNARTIGGVSFDGTANITVASATGGFTVTGVTAANGGITFDASTDTIGAFTAAGTIDMNANILTNIGNSGTDFVASTGALNLAGILTANGGISIGSQTLTGTTGNIDYTNFDVVGSSGNLTAKGHAAIGSSATIDGYVAATDSLSGTTSHKSVLLLNETLTALSSATTSYEGLASVINLNPSTAPSYTGINGFNGGIEVSSGNAQNFSGALTASNGSVFHSGSGTLTDVIDMQGVGGNLGGGTITSNTNFRALTLNVSGTISNNYGLKVETPLNFGTVTNNYGLYVTDQSSVGSGLSYNIYSSGTSSKNYFEGSIIAGTGNEILTLASGKIDADALTLTVAADGGSGTSSGSGLIVRSDGIGLLQGCSDGQILKWVESTDTWDCSADATGGGGVSDGDKGDITVSSSGATYTLDADITKSFTGALTFAPSGTNNTTFTNDSNSQVIFNSTDDNTADFTSTSNQNLAFTASGTGDIFIATDSDTNLNIYNSGAPGADIFLINDASTGTTTTGVDGMQIIFKQGDDADATDTNAGLTVAITSSSGDADTLYGINVDNITGGSAAETGLRIGTGWDTGLKIDSGGINVTAGQITASNQGIEFTESDTNPTCSAGNFNVYADLSENKLKQCVNGTVSDIGASTKYETFSATGTYTKPSDASLIIVEAWGAGGGGGGGAGGTNAAARTGGGGGGGGAYATSSFLASNIGSSVPVTVGTGGTNGTAGSSAAGGNGGAGNPSCFSTTTNCAGTMYLRAYGGGGGAGAGTAGNGGGAGGGTHAVGGSATTATGATGGGPLGAAAGAVNSGSGGAGGATATTTGANGGAAQFGGAGGGASTTAGGNNSGNGGTSIRGGAGGGGGGSCAITTCTARNGGAGGKNLSGLNGGGGTAGSASNGGTGSDGNSFGGDGGGGGANNASGNGYTGGNGGAQGGGAGGGGGAHTGATVGGAGGTGGRGEVRVWTVRGSGADLAETYGTKDDVEPGDVVCLDPTLRAGVKKCTNKYDPTAMGIITTSPGLVIGDVEDANVKAAPVVLAGRTPIKVSGENGPVEAGDLLTSSSVPGVAMKATKAGQIIGQAMAPFHGDGVGLTMVFVKTNFSNGSKVSELFQQADSQVGATDGVFGAQALAYLMGEKDAVTADTSFSEIYTDRLYAGLEVVTPRVIADNVKTNTLAAASGDSISINLAENDQFVIKDKNGETVVSFDEAGNATFAGTITVDTIKANRIEGLVIATNQIEGLDGNTSENQTDNNSQANDRSSVDLAKFKTIDVALDLSVAGNSFLNGSLTVAGQAEFNGRAIFDNLVTFNANTEFAGDSNFAGRATFNNDAGGFAIVKAGQTEAKVIFKKPFADKPIVTLTNADGSFVRYAYKDLTPEGFTLVIDQTQTNDMTFSWTALSVKEAVTINSEQ